MNTKGSPLTSNGGIDLPPANEIKASFPSLCYFQLQPTGRGTRMEVGNRPYSGVGGLNGKNSEHQTPQLKAKGLHSAQVRPLGLGENNIKVVKICLDLTHRDTVLRS